MTLPILDAKETNPPGLEELRSVVYNWECPYKVWRMVETTTGEAYEFDCKSWHCPVHSTRVQWRWMTRLGGIPWRLFVTLTLVPEDREVATKSWQLMRRYLVEQGMTTFVRVLEYGSKTGMRHWHLLLEGVERIDVDELRKTAVSAGLGSWCHVRRVTPGLGSLTYLLKYATKDMGDRDERRKGWRMISCSRNVPTWGQALKKLNVNLGRDVEGEFTLWMGARQRRPHRI